MEVPFKHQFRCHKFRLNYHFEEDFVLHQWQNVASIDAAVITYRFLFFTALLVTSYVLLRSTSWEWFEPWRRIIYFSNWTLCMCMMYALLSLIILLIAYVNQHEDPLGESMPRAHSCVVKAIWIIHTISLDCSICTGIAIGGLQVFAQVEMELGSKIYHMLVPMYMVMDLFTVSMPERIAHCYISVLYGATYILFSYLYQLSGLNNLDGADYIYEFTDWKRTPVTCAIYSSASIALVIAVRFLVYWLYRLKQRMRDFIFDSSDYNIETGRSYASANDSSCNLSRF